MIVKYCWIVSSCLAAYILPKLALKSLAAQRLWTVNPAFFDLIGNFKHFDIDMRFWASAMSWSTLY